MARIAVVRRGSMGGEMGRSLLLVGSDPELADAVRRAFAPAGFQVTAVPRGRSALEACAGATPDLVVVSAELPDMSGYSVCTRMKRAVRSLPVIVCAAESAGEAVEEHQRTPTHADAYVRLPVDAAALLRRATELVEASERTRRDAPAAANGRALPVRVDDGGADALRGRLRAVESLLAGTRHKLAAQEREAAARAAQLEQRLAEAEAGRRRAEESLAARAPAPCGVAEAERDSALERCRELEARASGLQARCDAAEAEVAALRARREALEGSLGKERTAGVAVEEQLRLAQAEAAAAVAKLAAQGEAARAVEARLADAWAQSARLGQAIEIARRDLGELPRVRAELHAAQAAVEALEREKALLVETVQGLRRELQERAAELEEAAAAEARAREDLREQQVENELLNGELARCLHRNRELSTPHGAAS